MFEALHTSLRRCARIPAALGALGVLLTWSGSAAADGRISADIEANFPRDREGVERGWGAGLRLGKIWDFWLVEVSPELGASYHRFGGHAGVRAYRGVAGARLSLGLLLKPSAFLHAGVGHLGYSAPQDRSNTDLTLDAGVGLDFTLIPLIDLGVHVALTRIRGDEEAQSFSWVAAGAHVALNF